MFNIYKITDALILQYINKKTKWFCKCFVFVTAEKLTEYMLETDSNTRDH